MNQQESMNSASTEGREPRMTMPKSARLRHRTLVNTLFEKGKNVYVYPMRGAWRVLDEEELATSFRRSVPEGIGPVQLMVTVPKKKRRHAVDRVRMRRLIKEAFRKRRHRLVELAEGDEQWRTLSLALIYIADKNLDYQTIDRKMGLLFKKLTEALADRNNKKESEGERVEHKESGEKGAEA